ncbi:hypothetical protein AMTR_s03210p00000790 [Amborella trichopoda]|uniref:Uncharacterized protein n=1 Tax=Amborella trichopoda TaxID=13333 RepID=U5CUL4_AMBTC|nr:hypothetical protein AMTR_s03210p00000790 [Amborella trichopoda]
MATKTAFLLAEAFGNNSLLAQQLLLYQLGLANRSLADSKILCCYRVSGCSTSCNGHGQEPFGDPR